MNAEQAKRIIENENLRGCVWYDEPIRAESIVIRKISETGWEVFTTDERAGIWTEGLLKYNSEPDLFEELIERLRARKRYAASYRQETNSSPFSSTPD